MVLRSLILFVAIIVLPDVYNFFRHRRRPLWRRLLSWLPSVLMLGYTSVLACERNFMPDNQDLLFLYLLLLGIYFIPRLVYTLCAAFGWSVCHWLGKRMNYGKLLGWFLALGIVYVVAYGSLVGFRQFEVRHVEYASSALPDAFDGYRIVQFSDAHVGTLTGRRQDILKRAVDSINAQRPDLIAFTGDLQNMQPQELYPHLDLLSGLNAKDGVYSVLGNHDYAEYIDGDDVTKVANCRETCSLERQMGWTLLNNAHRSIRRGRDSIIIAGMENDGEGRFPQNGDPDKTLRGVRPTDFVVMLEHDPTSWRRKILPQTKAQLTLSGHTHAGQMKIGGTSPVALRYKEWQGLYADGDRAMSVSSGVGGLIPFRFGVPGEIVVITLRKK